MRKRDKANALIDLSIRFLYAYQLSPSRSRRTDDPPTKVLQEIVLQLHRRPRECSRWMDALVLLDAGDGGGRRSMLSLCFKLFLYGRLKSFDANE